MSPPHEANMGNKDNKQKYELEIVLSAGSVKDGKPISDRWGLSEELTFELWHEASKRKDRHGKTGEECSRKRISKCKDPELGESDWCVLGDGRQPLYPQSTWEQVTWGWRVMQEPHHSCGSHWKASSWGQHSLRCTFRRSHWLLYGDRLKEGTRGSGKTKVRELLLE